LGKKKICSTKINAAVEPVCNKAISHGHEHDMIVYDEYLTTFILQINQIFL